jgi:hypothetical protein
MKNNNKRLWVYAPETIKLSIFEKQEIISKIKKNIEILPKLAEKISRLEIRGNRIYFYELVEQNITEGAIYTKPLIDDKYFEFIYSRITLNDKSCSNCTVDCQRHNNAWFSLFSGNLENCLNYIESDDGWF